VPIFRAEECGFRSHLRQRADGCCHAGGDSSLAPADMRYRCCNQGYSRKICTRFPTGEDRATVRFSIERRTDTTLDLICIEESEYAPVRWYPLQYCFASADVEPQTVDPCVRAQAVALSKSYLKRFSS
jgi:hypothetical protein